jgi:hypothetical protein
MRPGRLFLRWRSAPAAPYPLFGRCLQMTTIEPFTPRTPDPDKAPRPPTRHYPAADEPGKPILVPSKSKAAFLWPPDCLWPFRERIGNHEWDGDA